MNPFRNTLWLSAGDLVAKALNFIALIYLARTLGVANYGSLEFAITVLTYFALIADAGLEIWSIRESAKGVDLKSLVGKIIPLRFLFATIAFGLLMLLLPVFPDYYQLLPILIILGLTLVVQAINLKWVFLGKEKMRLVGLGLILAQVFFICGMLLFVRKPEQLVLVVSIWLVSEVASAVYFGWLFISTYGLFRMSIPLYEYQTVIKPAATIGIMQAMGIMNYNFDSLLLGFLTSPEQVGWYRAAYKPITAAVSVPLAYFAGLLPALTRGFSSNQENFHADLHRSLRLTVLFALPIGVVGTILARPIINLLYGPDYSQSILIMQILSWSTTLILIRATLRHGLVASGRQDLALRTAIIAVGLNVILNLVLIQRFGMIGAAITTILSEIVWLVLSIVDFSRVIEKLRWSVYLFPPFIAAIVMAGCLLVLTPVFWPVRALIGGLVYFIVLFLFGEIEVRALVHSISSAAILRRNR